MTNNIIKIVSSTDMQLSNETSTALIMAGGKGEDYIRLPLKHQSHYYPAKKTNYT